MLTTLKMLPKKKKKEAHGLLELINLVNSEKLYKGDNINI